MKILYVAMKYDYGFKERGLSFEHHNFYDSISHIGAEVTYFDFMTEMQEHGKRWMNKALLQTVKEVAPDLMFTVLFKDQIDKSTLSYITNETETMTVNWFCDDHWRFDNFSQYYAPCFDYVVTTALSALPKYEAIGYKNVIKSQWACNHFLYRNLGLPLEYDLTFIGQPHSDRRQVMEAVRDAGIRADAWGNGWERGRVSQDEMIRIFNQSRINLNLSNSSVPSSGSYSGFRKYRDQTAKVVKMLPGGSSFITTVKKVRSEPSTRKKGPVTSTNVGKTYSEQIKGRNFEVPGCGGFVLSSAVDELDKYFKIGREVVCYEDTRDLIEKARFYLQDEEERAAIAKAGYSRTMREHTYLHRFKDIFSRIGLEHKAIDTLIHRSTTMNVEGHEATSS